MQTLEITAETASQTRKQTEDSRKVGLYYETTEEQAENLGNAVLKDKTPEAARRFIGFLDRLYEEGYTLNPREYDSGNGQIKAAGLALDLVVPEVKKVGLPAAKKIRDYELFMRFASLHGLSEQAKEYRGTIADLEIIVDLDGAQG